MVPVQTLILPMWRCSKMLVNQLYRRLAKKGLLVTSEDDGQIAVSPSRLLTDKDRRQIRRNKDGLLKIVVNLAKHSSDQHGQTKHRASARADGELASFCFGDEDIVARRYRREQSRVYEGRLALDCETEVIDGPTVPRLALVSVSDGKNHYLVHPDDLGAFVLAHADLPIVFHNAAFDFWVVHEHLVRHKRPKAAAAWMTHLRQRRLHDTMLLDMLVRLADGTDNRPDIPARDLGEVTDQYVGIKLDKQNPYRLRFSELIGANWSEADPGFFAYALPDAIATARAYPKLRRRGLQLMKEYGLSRRARKTFEIDPDAVREFGVLTESVQVGSAIALAKIERIGMHTDQQRLDKTAAKYHREMERNIRKINRKYPDLFKLDRDGKITYTTKTGVPRRSDTALYGYLLKAVEQIVAKTSEPVEVPHTSKGHVATSRDDWEPLLGKHPFLDLWFTHQETAKLYQFLRSLSSAVVHPHYRVLCRTGRTTCSKPNMQQVPRQDDFREVICPSPGHLLLTIDYAYIELVTLAAACQCRFGFSKLAEVIRTGTDPHCYTAAMLLGMNYEKFMRLKSKDPDKFKQWRQASKPINFGVPGGLGAEALVTSARRSYHVEMTLEDARHFRQRLIEEVYPELKLYMEDTSLEALADNLGATLSDVWAVFGITGADSSRASGSVRKIVEVRPVKQDGTPYSEHYVERVWNWLNELNRRSELGRVLSMRVGSEDLADRLFSTSVATISGRIRAGVLYTAERNTQFQGLASDGAKLALTALVAYGYRVVGFVHDEILVELADQGGYVRRETVENVVRIVRNEMEKVTYGVPVGCEYTISRLLVQTGGADRARKSYLRLGSHTRVETREEFVVWLVSLHVFLKEVI